MSRALCQDFIEREAISVSSFLGKEKAHESGWFWSSPRSATDGEYQPWLVKEPRKLWWPLAGQSFDAIILLNLMERWPSLA